MPEADEPALDTGRPIIDPHLHLWHIQETPGAPQKPQRFLFDELLQTVAQSGHRITHTVAVEAHQMYRADGPPELRTLGETEFLNGVAAMSATGSYGPCRVAHRIVGTADLTLRGGVAEVLEAHVARAGERFRGIRMNTAFSEAGMYGFDCDPLAKTRLVDPDFVAGARVLAKMDLSLDVWCVHTQLDQLIALADKIPELTIVLDHLGTPETMGAWAGRADEAFAQWHTSIRDLALRPNVFVKLGGMGMDMTAPIGTSERGAFSEALAREWAPRVEAAIEAFTPARAMFESNFPPDRASASYGATWNAFKRITAGYSEMEKDELFRGTAARVYRIEI
jgi:L-fuconolactonase